MQVLHSAAAQFNAPWQAMIDEFDKDEDGEISEAEFFRIMKNSTLF